MQRIKGRLYRRIQMEFPELRKLRDSIREIKHGVVDKTQKLFRRTRYWREKLDDLARQGHGPQRHEDDVTDTQLFDRIYRGLDPMTSRTRDDVHGRAHRVGRNATKFNTPSYYVRAHEKAIDSSDYMAFLSSTIGGRKLF